MWEAQGVERASQSWKFHHHDLWVSCDFFGLITRVWYLYTADLFLECLFWGGVHSNRIFWYVHAKRVAPKRKNYYQSWGQLLIMTSPHPTDCMCKFRLFLPFSIVVLEGTIMPRLCLSKTSSLPWAHSLFGDKSQLGIWVRHDCNEWLPGSKHKPVNHGMFTHV